MGILKEFCEEKRCNKEDHYFLHIFDDVFRRNPKLFLLHSDREIYKKVHKKVSDDYNEKEILSNIRVVKKILLEEIESVLDLKKISDEDIIKIEEKNNLTKYTILDKKLYFVSGAYKVYGEKLYDLYAKLIRHVYENQKFETKIVFSEKQKIMVKCAEEAYHFSKENLTYRPDSFLDPKHNTIYEYIDGLSDINKAIWCNDDKNIFRRKVVIIGYRGTGVETKKNKFSFSGNYKRDFVLDLKIAQGRIAKSATMKKIIKNFDKIYKEYGKDYDFYVTGHSLGGRLAYEVHKARPDKIKECHIVNAGFGLDIGYLNDIIKSKKRNFKWEKNLHNYHIGGKSIEPTDDDFISLLAGGYGNSSTFYKNFNKGLEGHSILNFYK